MQETVFIRHIDDLGRVSIPKEIRRMMRIRPEDALECYATCDGVMFRKYSIKECIAGSTLQFCDSIASNFGLTVAVTDKNNMIAVSGENMAKHDLLGKRISNQVEQIISNRHTYQYNGENENMIFIDDSEKYFASMITPIIYVGEALGSVLIIENRDKPFDSDAGYKVSKTIATFLEKQIDI